MGACTREQNDIVLALHFSKRILSVEASLREGLVEVATRIGALQTLLVSKGLVAAEELEAAVSEIKVATMVDKVLDPEWKARNEEIAQLQKKLKRLEKKYQKLSDKGA
jgi:predicted RNase H-like nuclease (RuvC/YqgF family)